MKYKSIVGIGVIIILAGILFFALGINPEQGGSPGANNEAESPDEDLEDLREIMNRQAEEYPETFFVNGPETANRVALTFDDGPDPLNTPRILDVLAEKNVRATFFLLGENVERFPEIAQRILNEGHQIGNHSWSHPNFRDMDDQEVLNEEIYPTSDKIAEITGHYPTLLRPPFGAINNSTIESLQDQGWKIANWSMDSYDWHISQDDPDEIINRIQRIQHPGGIVLLHDGIVNRVTAEALPGIIDMLREEGYEFNTLNELLAEYMN